MVSLFLRSSGVTAKIGWCNKVYHDNTEHNYVLAFVLKKMAARFLEISEEEMQKLAERAIKKNAVGTVWKSWAGSKGLNDAIVD